MRKAVFCLAFLFAVTHLLWSQPVTFTVRIDAASPIRVMRGGMGASWHAMETPIPGSNGGSGWGAYPPAEDNAAWESIYRHADWLGFDWCRVEIEQRVYESERRKFDWDTPEMRILYRILDWAESRHVHVFLQQMWGNTVWNSYPELRDDPARRVKSAPVSLEEYAYGIGELVQHLVRDKHYSSIRWLAINNEPGHNFSWWQGPDLQPLPIAPAFKAVRDELDRRGIDLPVSGPDWTDLPPLKSEEITFDSQLGAYDIHSYSAVFNREDVQSGRWASTATSVLRDWSEWAHQHGKPLFLSEVGSFVYGWGGSDPAPGEYEAGLMNAALAVKGINAGVDGFNRWSFLNRGDLDGQWQLLDTWDAPAGRLLKSFSPHMPAYYSWGILTRYTALNSTVLPTTVEGGLINGVQNVSAASLRSPKGHYTVIVLNESQQDAKGVFRINKITAAQRLFRYRITPQMRNDVGFQLKSDSSFAIKPGEASFEDSLPARSITVYSTYDLKSSDPGVQAE